MTVVADLLVSGSAAWLEIVPLIDTDIDTDIASDIASDIDL